MLRLKKLSKLFYFKNNGKFSIVFLLAIAFFLIITLPFNNPEISRKVQLDGLLFYSPEDAYSTIQSYGDDGRAYMLWLHLVWDFIFPFLYTMFFILLLSWSLQKAFRLDSKVRLLNLIAIMGGSFDILENIAITVMIISFPNKIDIVAWISTIFTLSKYLSGLIIIVLIVISLFKSFLLKQGDSLKTQ